MSLHLLRLARIRLRLRPPCSKHRLHLLSWLHKSAPPATDLRVGEDVIGAMTFACHSGCNVVYLMVVVF